MDAIQAIMSRKSIRKYKAEEIPQQSIEAILKAAMQAPNAGNRQDWFFLVVKSPEIKQQMAATMTHKLQEMAAWPEAAHMAERLRRMSSLPAFMASAPVVLVVFARPFDSPMYHIIDAVDARMGVTEQESKSRHMVVSMQSASAAVENALLAAHALGYGGCWMGAGMAATEIRTILGMPDPWEIVAYVPIGVPDESPKGQPRKTLEEIYRVV